MNTATINNYKIKKDEMMRQAEHQRLVREVVKSQTEIRLGKIIRQLFS